MKLKILYAILLISFLTGCTANREEESKKYKMYIENSDSFMGAILITVEDEQGKDVIELLLDEDDGIEAIYVNDNKGFDLRVMKYDEVLQYIIGDTNILYQNTTYLNPTDGLLIYREEDFQTISQKHQLFDTGQTEIEHWDYINEKWIREEEFRKQLEESTNEQVQ